MAWAIDNERPIYAQLVEEIKMRIVSGFYKPGDKLPSVRELAAEAAVNPNTMQRAFAELEKSNLIITMRTSGRLVTEDIAVIENIKSSLAQKQIQAFFEKMQQLGFCPQDTISLVEKTLKEAKS